MSELQPVSPISRPSSPDYQPSPPNPPGMDNPPHSPPRPSSSGSTKRPLQDDISELVRKAKASRYAQPVRKSFEDDIADTLERDLSCAICSEVLTNPVACFDCLHNFCGSCLVPWLEKSNTCPTCRQVVKKARDNHSTASLIETILNRYPDKRRDPEELKELELIYKPGQKINISAAYNDEDDDQRDGDDDEVEEESHITWPPCPCCIPDNPHGFTCPDPIPSPSPAGEHQIADVYAYRNHLHCQTCQSTFPNAWKSGWKCENCSMLYCGNLFTCTGEGVLQPVRDQAGVINAGATVFLPNFNGNIVESTNFEEWRNTNNHSLADIASKIYEWLISKNDGYFPASQKRLLEEDYACFTCVSSPIQNNFLNWWCSEKVTEGFVDGRTRCWYGRACRTQFSRPEHAQRLAHAWEEMPLEERHQAGGRARRAPEPLNAEDEHNENDVPVSNVIVADNTPVADDAAPIGAISAGGAPAGDCL